MENVVVAHYDENLAWLRHIQKRKVVIASHSIKHAPIYQDNVGYEASLYLAYIIKNYETLTEYTFFVHGHRRSWHHVGNLDELLNKTECTVPYKNINAESEWHHFKEGDRFYGQMRRMIGEDIEVPEGIPYFKTHKAAMFYIHRDLIHKHPKELYQKWLDKIMNKTFIKEGVTENDKSVAVLFEWMWCFIFTGYLDEAKFKEDCLNGKFPNPICSGR